MAGSPFFVIKTEKRKPSEKTIEEVAQATASYSKAWKLGISTADVFHVNPDQVTKEALSGEFIPRGAFMIYGKKNELTAILKISIGIKKGKIIGGPVEAIKKNAEKFVIVVQGNDKASAIAKKIKKKLGDGDLDDIIRFLPSGNFALA